ncbi:dual specificity protein phosphatase 12-like [Asterias rubens]|uniref:dual specificity protein phosphatase 12-like n=1 Tax=Asterias rubens TaxID=7604 RepID=UPI001454EC3D|nr:dual specificity protein phosphatase 12-like [Asterias rubens]
MAEGSPDNKPYHMDEVCKGLFLGSRDAVLTLKGQHDLLKHSITHVLSIEWSKPDISALNLNHKFVYINDMPSADILSHFEECIAFIDEVLTSSGNILVHCMMGISRSSTIVIAYLMHRDKITFQKAFDLVKEKHPRTEPNDGFVDMLCLFEAMGCQFSSSHPLYRQHRLGQIAPDIQAGSQVPEEFIAADPAQESASTEAQTVYKCRKCRRAVFFQSMVLAHITGKGQTSFSWHKQMHPLAVTTSPSSTMDSSISCTSLFVEPVKWMEPLLVGCLEGKLCCPKCSSRLGSFNWSGLQCSCGAWVTPAFQIHQNRVDKSIRRQIVQSNHQHEDV